MLVLIELEKRQFQMPRANQWTADSCYPGLLKIEDCLPSSFGRSTLRTGEPAGRREREVDDCLQKEANRNLLGALSKDAEIKNQADRENGLTRRGCSQTLGHEPGGISGKKPFRVSEFTMMNGNRGCQGSNSESREIHPFAHRFSIIARILGRSGNKLEPEEAI